MNERKIHTNTHTPLQTHHHRKNQIKLQKNLEKYLFEK